MASLLPPFPRLIFTIIEPISLFAGFCGAVLNPSWFIAEQIPNSDAILATKGSVMVAWQLGNLYLLMAFMGLFILRTTSEVEVVKAYLLALWLGDIGHIGFTAFGLGGERLMNMSEWNAVTHGNLPFTAFLFLTRSAYFLGLFGPDRQAVFPLKKKA